MCSSWVLNLQQTGTGKEYAVVIFQAECLSTPQHGLVLDLEQTGHGRSLPQRQPRSQVAAQLSQFLQPQCPDPPTPAYSTPQPCTRSGMNITKRGVTLGSFWVEPQKPTQVARKSSVTTWASLASAIISFGAGQMEHSRAMEPDQTQPSGLLLQQLLSRPCPWHGGDNHGAKRNTHLTSRTASRYYNINHIPYQRDNSQHTLRKDMAGICTKNSPHTKNIRYTQSTQVSSHIKTPLQDHNR